jgi:hypothetical protein
MRRFKCDLILSAATMYMAMSSLTYILFFYCDIFSASLFRLGILGLAVSDEKI